MARKPRPSWQDFTDEHYDEKTGGWVFDAGTYGDDNAVAPEPPKRERGRPLGSASIDYTDMDVLIGFWLRKPTDFPQQVMLDQIRYFYAQRHGRTPHVSTIKNRIETLKLKRK
jgi:hypothetical protein